MNTNYAIKNFRVFDNNGANVELNPISILTGCNSSGKSSIVKSILLLDSFLKKIKTAIDRKEPIELNKYKLDFTIYPNNLLGRFDRVVNFDSDSKMVTFEYSLYSKILSANIDVRMEFCADENDEINNAYLHSLAVLRDGVVIYYSDNTGKSFCNLNAIKDQFFSFVETEYVVHNYNGLESGYEFDGTVSKEEYEKQNKLIIDFLRSINKNRRDDIFRYVRTSDAKTSLIVENGIDPKILEWSKENDSFFNIPILDYLSSIDKKCVAENIHSILAKESEAEKIATEKVLDNFISSEYSTFREYFNSFEHNYLEKIHSSDFLRRQPFLPSVLDMNIEQTYISWSPLHKVTIGWFSDDDNIIESEDLTKDKESETQQWKNKELSFAILYETVMYWNQKYTHEKSEYYYDSTSIYNPVGGYIHNTYKLLCAYANRLIHEAITPDWAGNMSYVSSSRVDVKRLYSLDAKDDFTQLLKKYYEEKRLFAEKRNHHPRPEYEPNSFLNKWIKIFGIGEYASFHIDDEGLGVQIRLHKKDDDRGRLLADEGYGITQLVSILIQIETAILSAQGEKINRWFNMENLDQYDTDKFHYEINTIAIEEPEIHLHPRLQSLLADMFVDAYKNYNIHVLVETHSEYLIRKLQTLVAGLDKDLAISNKDVSLLYIFSKDEAELQNEPQVKQIGICKDGYLNDSFGSGFFDEANSLSRKLM